MDTLLSDANVEARVGWLAASAVSLCSTRDRSTIAFGVVRTSWCQCFGEARQWIGQGLVQRPLRVVPEDGGRRGRFVASLRRFTS